MSEPFRDLTDPMAELGDHEKRIAILEKIAALSGAEGGMANSEHTLLWGFSGTPVDGQFSSAVFPATNGSIRFIKASCTAVPVATAAMFDVLKNGESLFISADRPVIDIGAQDGAKFVPDTTFWLDGDRLEIVVVTAAGITKPKVYIEYI